MNDITTVILIVGFIVFVTVLTLVIVTPKKKNAPSAAQLRKHNEKTKHDNNGDVSVLASMTAFESADLDGKHKKYHDTDLSSQSLDAGSSSPSYDGGGSDGGGGGGGE
ncbi:hypothetical protein [Terribacillus halophilus]|uniref:hypothetical protein n=1 Tax=Terribacillus halophilus TaxID=361279 RepID=UPI0009869D77|nr:hypothetical protein [Terribacillus halophilus]